MSTTPQLPKLKSRWYQFSLRTLLVVMLVSCFGFAVIGIRMQRARKNRARVATSEQAIKTAVTEIEKLGGKVTTVYEELRPRSWLETQFDDPGDADDPIGVRKVTVVNFFYDNVTDADLLHLKGLTSLQELSLSHTDISDAGLVHLKGMIHLRVLDLTETGVTRAGLEHLKGLTNLRELTLFDTYIGEKTVAEFQQALPKCRVWSGSVAP